MSEATSSTLRSSVVGVVVLGVVLATAPAAVAAPPLEPLRAVAETASNFDDAAVTTTPLGPAFPHGLLVLHDGENTPVVPGGDGEPRTDTNFKLIRLG